MREHWRPLEAEGAKRAIRPIPSCKETTPAALAHNLPTPSNQATTATTDGTSAFGSPPESLPKKTDFHGTLKTDPKPPNRARRFLRKFFQMVTDNRTVLRA